MKSNLTRNIPGLALALAASTVITSEATAQTRLSIPARTVMIVETNSTLQSSSARAGQTFDTRVVDAIGVDDYTVIPAGSHVRGSITYARPATQQQSGVIEVDFNRIVLPDGTSYPIVGRLTSTDANERRQIDQDPNARVVLVGGRGGIGATIAGAGSASNPVSGILSALGGLLSQGQDVRVPAGTQLAVQLDQPVTIRSGRRLAAGDQSIIYTAADRIRAAQEELARQNYYHGSITGQLDYATQRALFDYQTAKGLRATGNLDYRTAASLGITAATVGGIGIGGNNNGVGNSLSSADASTLRREAQTLAAQQRTQILGTSSGYARRASQADVDLWFALSAFADNASLYEQLARNGQNGNVSAAGSALINAARRVDSAIIAARASSTVQNSWASIRARLVNLDRSYR
jgi:putative peptidoglycan binding protein